MSTVKLNVFESARGFCGSAIAERRFIGQVTVEVTSDHWSAVTGVVKAFEPSSTAAGGAFIDVPSAESLPEGRDIEAVKSHEFLAGGGRWSLGNVGWGL